jgi:hypothetical protein
MNKSFPAFFILALGLAFLPARAASLDEANRAFAEGRFHDSTTGYQAVLDEKGFSAPVLYDLGNSCFREGNMAQAILAYKRAQWLAPDDADIAANLSQTQKQAGVTVTEPARWEKYTGMLSASGWAWAASAAWTLVCVNHIVWWLWPKVRSLLTLPGFACAVALMMSVAAIFLTAGKFRQGVVVAKNASALISPFPAAQTVFSPASGETLTVHKRYHDFLLVSDQTGHSGWMDKAQIAPVVKE